MNYSEILDLILIPMWIAILSLNTYLLGHESGERAARKKRETTEESK